MYFPTLITGLAFMSATGWAQYVLEDDYTANGNFFDQFQFYNDSDPTHGFVDYVQRDSAESAGLINNNYGKVYMGVDHTNVASKRGRPAVRIESTKTYDNGLVVIDIEHMPGGICGTWPAFWMFGPNWPKGGEIDILEGVNDQSKNDFTLHTSSGCRIDHHDDMIGKVNTDNCDVKAKGQGTNEGCKIKVNDERTYGKGFNDNKGGVYATEIMEDFINIFFFPRGEIPDDVFGDSPDPSSWGKPMAAFKGGCDIPSHFKNMQLTFTNTFCGDWAGNVWEYGSCASKADTCVDFVQNNPDEFEDAYWSINDLKVYKFGGYGGTGYGTTSKPVSSSKTGFSTRASSSKPVSYSSVEVNTSSTSRRVYSTKNIDIPMPSGVDYAPSGLDKPISSASPTIAAETSGNGGLVPSQLIPTKEKIMAASATSAAVAAQVSSEARQRPNGWESRGSHRHWRNSEKTARHLRQHKRHGNGLL
ncbi:hypothetical protein Q7P37_011444 [Cladosporium fusiforme]